MAILETVWRTTDYYVHVHVVIYNESCYCNTGYQVSGPASAYCILSDDNLLAQQQIQTVADLNVQGKQLHCHA